MYSQVPDNLESWNQDGDENGIYAQIFCTDGTKEGTEFRVNSYTTGDQKYPTAASLSDGKFVITWSSEVNDERDTKAQIFNSDGFKLGSEFRVNTYTNSNQDAQCITSLEGNRFAIGWESYQQISELNEVYLRIYDNDGSQDVYPLRVNTWTYGEQNAPEIALLTDNKFVITWSSDLWDGDKDGVCAQIFESDGTKSGNEFGVNTYPSGDQNRSSVASLPNGRFIIAWASFWDNDIDSDIKAQIFESDGTSIGEEFQVNTQILGTKQKPVATSLYDDRFVIVWESYGHDGNSWG